MEIDIELILFVLLIITGAAALIRYLMPNTLGKYKILKESVGLFTMLLLVFSFRSFAFEPFRIPSGSMKPVLFEGDIILIDKFSHGLRWPIIGKRITVSKPNRGDIVVFRGEVNGKPAHVIKRIIGLPGDHIQYKNKQLKINGKTLEKNLIRPEYDDDISGARNPVLRFQEIIDNKQYDIYNYPLVSPNKYPYDDIVVPANQYFVMGNNRDNSHDSRYWGFLSDDKVVGHARCIWLSVNPNAFYQIRWERIGRIY